MTKIIKLFANLATEEEVTNAEFQKHKVPLSEFVLELSIAVSKSSLADNEEFILNAVSCITNILYYDTAQSPILTPESRSQVFACVKKYLLETKNDEIQIETVRVLSNLSRHASFCENDFHNDKGFLEAIVIVLENTLRDLVFYSVGILINMSLHSSVNEYLLECNLIMKLVDVLKDSNIEDMDLARVAAKALHNL